MRIPRQAFVVIGGAAVLAAVALGATTFSRRADYTAFAGIYSQTAQPDPTVDPCIPDVAMEPGNDLVMAQSPDCTPTEETPPKTHTPTPESTPEDTVEVPTEPASTSTTAPPVATSTPSGGAGAGDLTPPNTGSNGNASATNANWLIIAAGLALAIGGTSALGYGLRKN